MLENKAIEMLEKASDLRYALRINDVLDIMENNACYDLIFYVNNDSMYIDILVEIKDKMFIVKIMCIDGIESLDVTTYKATEVIQIVKF